MYPGSFMPYLIISGGLVIVKWKVGKVGKVENPTGLLDLLDLLGLVWVYECISTVLCETK